MKTWNGLDDGTPDIVFSPQTIGATLTTDQALMSTLLFDPTPVMSMEQILGPTPASFMTMDQLLGPMPTNTLTMDQLLHGHK